MLPLLSDIPQLTDRPNITTLVEYKNRSVRKSYCEPDDKKTIASSLSPEIRNLFEKYQIQTFSQVTKTKVASFLDEGDLMELANEIFKNAQPLIGEEYDILINTLYKNAKMTSTIKGML